MVSTSDQQCHIIIFGCSGFTGRQACKYISETYGLPNEKFNYAIAGRDLNKLKDVELEMIKVAKFHGSTEVDKVKKIVVNIEDEASIYNMCQQTKCLLTFAGPYTLCGEPLIKACANNGVHYVDITGEIPWMSKMYDTYNEVAIKNRAKIVPCCGFDFVPNDLSLKFLHTAASVRQLSIQSITQYVELNAAGVSGGTLRSAVNGIFNKSCCNDLMNNQYRFCKERPSMVPKPNNCIHYNSDIRRYVSPTFWGPLMEGYIRWSNEVQSFPWGKNVPLAVRQSASNPFKAFMNWLSFYIVPFVLLILNYLPAVAQMITPKSGEASFNYEEAVKQEELYGGTIITVADVEHTESKDKKTLTCSFRFKGEPYKFTTRTSVEAALVCVFDQTPEVFGLTSPSAAFGQAYVNRLNKLGGIDMVVLSVTSITSK